MGHAGFKVQIDDGQSSQIEGGGIAINDRAPVIRNCIRLAPAFKQRLDRGSTPMY
ncbi:MAG TPA: hypothetical protein VJN92_20045 [Candidatus Acidoferrum sp.]|nr:hypothetical protein [Candidatus Acidoferrum sp.]